ncbi:nitroreductase family deazaflavin-dependent oxidoreductase [Ornithinimicrobium faecis]|uniref:nitroreductase family deazaflavin-dependent oxidoreductase n=1 Tax=Ornithinimicrobium faecis TaxID=2934158 RepID=UPI0021191255|nr:nitroreductase family deazaflavin-dependent oxidoreductase [Ornithinimicrobium sp. HY1745]
MADLVRTWGARLLQNRLFVRAPIPMFRAGLGFLFTRRLLMLEHVGRSSGAARFVVLEVVSEESPTSLVVGSGFGPTAQWFRNLQAQPRCHVSIGTTRCRPALARVLDEGERMRVLTAYRVEHPTAWEKLSAVITEATGETEPDIPLVRLDLAATDAPQARFGPGEV